MTEDDLLDAPSLEANLDDLKTIYTVLLSGYDEHPELASNGFFLSLQALLEAQAHAEGVDVEDETEWTDWLHDVAPPPPEQTPRELLN